MINRLTLILALLLILTGIGLNAGCSAKQVNVDPAEVLLADGQWAWSKGNWYKAAKYYGQVRDYYPYHAKSTFAQIRAAESLYLGGQYQESLAAWQTFEELHPTSRHMAHILVRIGQCHYYLIPTVDRDMTQAHAAVESFKRLKRRFPKSKEAGESQSYLFESYRKLIAHELYVGRFYRKDKAYRAALGRFELAAKYPDVGYKKVIGAEIIITRALVTGKKKPNIKVPKPDPLPKEPAAKAAWYKQVWDQLQFWD